MNNDDELLLPNNYILNNFRIIEKIGKGSYGLVYLVKNVNKKKLYLILII